ncbi:hypothetical protein IWQ56_007118, partial [Coemansia nantahalensis]
GRVRDPVGDAGPPDHQPRAVDKEGGAVAGGRREAVQRARLGHDRKGAGDAAHGVAVLPGVPAQAQPRHVALKVDARGGPAADRGRDGVRRGRLAGGGRVPGQPHGPAGAASLVQINQPGDPLRAVGQGRGRGAAGCGAPVRRRAVDQDRQARAGAHGRKVPRALHERADAGREQLAVVAGRGQPPDRHSQPRRHRQVVVRRGPAGRAHRQPVLAPLAQPAQKGPRARSARGRRRERRGGHRAQLPRVGGGAPSPPRHHGPQRRRRRCAAQLCPHAGLRPQAQVHVGHRERAQAPVEARHVHQLCAAAGVAAVHRHAAVRVAAAPRPAHKVHREPANARRRRRRGRRAACHALAPRARP